MDNIPEVPSDTPTAKWANRAKQHIRQNQVTTSNDLVIKSTGVGTSIQLKRKFKFGDNERYKKEFDPDIGYSVGDMIRVLPDKDYADANGDVIKATVGVWICIVNIPSLKVTKSFQGNANAFKRYLRQDSVKYYPQWPEPDEEATLDSPDGRYWELISLLPKEIVSCDNGVETTHYVDSAIKPDAEDA